MNSLGAPGTLRRSQVEQRLAKAGLSGNDVAYYLDLLCDVGFLGIETRMQTYEYPADEVRRKVLRKAAQSRGTVRRDLRGEPCVPRVSADCAIG